MFCMDVFDQSTTIVTHATYTRLVHKIRFNCFTSFIVNQPEQEVSKCFTFGVIARYNSKCIYNFTCNSKVFFDNIIFPKNIQRNCCMLTLRNAITPVGQFNYVNNLYSTRIKCCDNVCYMLPIDITLVINIDVQQFKRYIFNVAKVVFDKNFVFNTSLQAVNCVVD